MKAKTGWILEIVSGILVLTVGRTFYSKGCKYTTLILVEAVVLGTRNEARELASADGTQVVRRVELDELGRATHIIPGR